jgi:O-antigen ligase
LTPTDEPPAARLLRTAGEFLLVAIATLSVWPFGSVEARDVSHLAFAVLALAAAWAAHAVVTREFRFRPDAGSVGLAGIVLVAAVQLVPLPEPVVAVLSPLRAEWHRTFLPAALEQLPGEAEAVPRPTSLTLTVNPSTTRAFLADALAVLIVYSAARNWLAGPAALRRLAWAAALTGIPLAAVALGQVTSSPRGVIYWTYPVPSGAAFGPFPNRNHYSDYLCLCLGLAGGLLLPFVAPVKSKPLAVPRRPDMPYAAEEPGWFKLITDPVALGLTAAVVLMAVSVPVSQSRGGTASALAAGGAAWALAWAVGGKSPVRFVGAAGVAGVVTVAAWVGGPALMERFGTTDARAELDNRTPIWRDGLRLVPGTWLTGTGADTFQWTEPTVRTQPDPFVLFDSVHNEYLEALTDGGVVRLAATLVLVGGVLWGVGRGYRRHRENPTGPLLLGAWYGLAALAIHSVADFGVRIPAVGVLAAAVAGAAMGAADWTPPAGKKARSRSRRGPSARPVPAAAAVTAPPPPPEPAGWAVRGPVAVAAAAGVVLAAAAVAADARNRAVTGWYRSAARVLTDRDEQPEFVVPYEAARAAARPTDTQAQSDLAEANFGAAVQAAAVAGQVVAGAAGYAEMATAFPPAVAERFAVPGLRAARDARTACPLNTRAHQALGTYGEAFARSEPAVAHFGRAKRLLSVDPYIWYKIGLDAYDRGDFPEAWPNWRGSLARGTAFQAAILTRARAKLPPAELRDNVLPDDPAAVLAAAAFLYPHRERQAADRRPFAEKAAALADKPGLTVPQLRAAVEAEIELGNEGREAAAWARLLKAAPANREARADFTSWTADRLMAAERYADALPQLEALAGLRPGDGNVRFRVTAAKHGIDLAAELK